MKTPYQRVDLDQITAHAHETAPVDSTEFAGEKYRFRWTVFPVSVLLCIVQTLIVSLTSNLRGDIVMMSTLIPVVGFAFIMAMVLFVNPLLKRIRRGRLFRPLNRVELTAIFTAMMVTSGIATFGLAE